MKLIYTTATFIFLSVYAFSQTGTIKGLVSTNDNQPAPYVNVLLKEINRGATTQEDGTFLLKNVKAGNYTVVTTFIGLESQEQSVKVDAGQTTSINFTLLESAHQLSEVVITDSRNLNDKPATIGKASIKPMDLPQSVMIIDKQILDRQQSLRISDVLMNTNGVYIMGATGGTQEEIAGRGFSYGSNNTFKNGVRFNNAVMPEISALERVEILKGSNAILFGNVAAGGVLNLVTKKPKFENGGELGFRIGSYEFYKPSIDVYGSLNKSKRIAYRINSSYENSKSFRNDVSGDRIYFNPSFLLKVGKNTEVLIEGDYLDDQRTLDYGTGAINYNIADVPTSRFLGATWSYFKAKQKSTSITVTHQLNTAWQLRALASYQGFESDQYGTTRTNNVVAQPNTGLVQPDGTWVRGLQRSGGEQTYLLGQLDATGKFRTGSIEHNLLFGADVDKYDNTSLAYTYRNPDAGYRNIYDTVNIFNINASAQRNDIPAIGRNTITENPINRVGIYIQDLVGITNKIKLLAGARYSYIESKSKVFTYQPNELIPVAGIPSNYYDDAFTPRVGVVYQPTKDISLFASYANSFNLNTVKDTTGTVLPPSMIDQFEAGIKNDLLKGLLSLNVTVYQIVNSNSPQPLFPTNPNYPNAQELAGEITSKGIEVDVMTKSVHGFSFIAGYSYNDTRYTKSKQFIENSRLRYNPAHTCNTSVHYTFSNGLLNGLNLGVIGLYIGDRVAGRSTQVNVANDTRKLMPVPNYIQFDATAGYIFNSIAIRLKVSNLLNELSYNIHDDNSVNPIAPRMFSATVSYKL